MTEIPPPPPRAEAPPHDGPPPDRPGWNTDHLRDYRLLRRAREDRHVAGVAGGLGRHLEIDPTIVRVLFVVLAFFGGAGVLLYGALWLLVPEEQTEETVVATSEPTRNALLIAAAVFAGLLAIGDGWGGFGFPWPLTVAAIVIVVVLLSRDTGARTGAPPPGTPGTVGGPGAFGGVAPGWQPPPAPAHQAAWDPAFPAEPYLPPVAYPEPPPRRRTKSGPLLFGPTLALLALALGTLWLVDATGAAVADAAYPALALAVIGAMLVVGAFAGRAGGLVLLGLVAALSLPAAAIGGPSFEGDRDLQLRPVTAAAVEPSYDVPAGRISLDLTAVEDVEQLEGRLISLDASAGEIVVTVPDTLRVAYDAKVEYGGMVETPDGQRDGWSSAMSGILNRDATTDVRLDIDVRFGHIEVRQS